MLLDVDRDEYISKKDLFRLFLQEREDIVVFPYNNMRRIEILDVVRGDRITKNEFLDLVAQFPYLLFPAYRLQSSFKEYFCGFSFWEKAKAKLQVKELQRRKLNAREQFFEKNKKKKEEDYNEKMEFYEGKIKDFNKEYFKYQRQVRNPLSRIRIPHRRASDGLIKVKFPIEEPYFDLPKLIERKKVYKEDNPYDMPITRDRFQYSFIWDRFTFYENENLEDQIRIDPTDLRIDLDKEFAKLIQKRKEMEMKVETSESDFTD